MARVLRTRLPELELVWVGGHRGLEARLVPAAGIRLRRLLLRSLRTVERDVHLVLDPVRLVASLPQALAILLAERPAAVLATGGYASIPVLVAARLLGLPALLWEGNVVPGRSVRATARLARVVAVADPATCGALGRAGRCYVTGTPIRDVRGVDREAARRRFEIPPGGRALLVFGGSQAVRRLNEAVLAALPELVERVWVLHVSGTDGYAAALAARERLPAERRERYRPYPFLHEEMTDALAAADLLVGRAGASTLAEAAAFGLPVVIVPYPHAAGHQLANAERVVAAGAGRLVPDEAFDAAALLDAAGLLDRPAEHARMAAAARSLARVGAAEAVAELVLALALRRPLPEPAAVERLATGSAD
ncbi:MAG: UDP-N-acetylglucosamine--N-acetylmuramyl-(pentapeptide) pyrophosphoryl-undecaprenol N-acetylglucosamine transferase [Chloroflexota bacterium]|nr:MAG: UDP-N-acetylglucosamine--N-acetylmuramyl-(pentapeptide) pyrophosphoryl-undecaprenol N-acetylglucosamine transferase [Chloroflexota bacterium]